MKMKARLAVLAEVDEEAFDNAKTVAELRDLIINNAISIDINGNIQGDWEDELEWCV